MRKPSTNGTLIFRMKTMSFAYETLVDSLLAGPTLVKIHENEKGLGLKMVSVTHFTGIFCYKSYLLH